MGLDTSARNRNRTSRALFELNKQNAALAEVLAMVPQTQAPALPVPIELYEFRYDYTSIVALGAVTSGVFAIGALPAGAFILTLTSEIVIPFVSSVADYQIQLSINLRSTGHDVSFGDSDPYDELGKIYHYIGYDGGTFPDESLADYGTTMGVKVNDFAFNQAARAARARYVPTVMAGIANLGVGAGTLDTMTAGEGIVRYIALRPFGL